MLLEWYKNGIAEAYIIFRNGYREKESLFIVLNNNLKKSFERLVNSRKEFENFLDQHKEIPFSNVKRKVEREGQPPYYDIKALFPRSKSKHKITPDRNIWQLINFEKKEKKGQCSICGQLGVKKNTVLLFPFERKVLNYFSVLNERKRLKLCPLCQKVCFYSFGNIFYNKSNDRVTIFFPGSEDYEKIARLAKYLKEIRLTDMETNYFSNIRPKLSKGDFLYYPFEFLYPTLFALYRWTKEKKEDLTNILSDVRIELVSYIAGRGLNIFDSYDSISRLDTLFKIFKQFENNIDKLNAELKVKGKELILGSFQIFNMFFNNLRISGKKPKDKNRLREEWVKTLLRRFKVDYIKLNEIVMDNIKTQKRAYRFIGFYTLIINSILEVVNMEEKQLFEKVNGIGWHLIHDSLKEYKEGGMTKDQMKSFVWDIFRTRTPEDFVDAVVGIQLKLRTNLDLREIHGNKSRWREIRAILLNGMANALYGKKEEGGK